MKVILFKDLEKLGKSGDVVEVKPGYGRNYLFPRNLAGKCTPAAFANLKRKKEAEDKEREKQKQKAEELSKKLSELSLTISCKAKEDEELFGSVTPQMIADALEEEGFSIAKEKIVLEEPIKKLGIYKIKINLFPEVESQVKVWIVKK